MTRLTPARALAPAESRQTFSGHTAIVFAAMAAVFCAAGAALAQVGPPFALNIADFFDCVSDGHVHVALDPVDDQDCTVGLGTADPHFCICNGGTYSVDIDSSLFVLRAGDTMTGALLISGSSQPGLEVQAATGLVWAELDNTQAAGSAVLRTRNPSQVWDVGLRTDGAMAVADGTASTTPLLIEPGAPTNAVVLEADGDVGIGRLNPGRELTVGGSDNLVFLRVESSVGARVGLELQDPSHQWQFHQENNTDSWELFDDTFGFDVITVAANAGADRITVAADGNVGINDPTPDALFDVNGDLKVGEPADAVDAYAQIDSESGAPPSADCDADSERGRTIHDFLNNRLYVCGGAARGWDFVALTD